jgi:3-methyladenine DNA glycosylase/8-oxoguanine DNA glycosylase
MGRNASSMRAPHILGLNDDSCSFMPNDDAMRALVHKFIRMRLATAPDVTASLVQIILSQLVSFLEASRAWSNLVARHGSAAPGPTRVRIPPNAAALRALSVDELLYVGATHKQARTIRAMAGESRALERAATNDPAAFVARLQAIAGIGPWTVANAKGAILGDADAVRTGDYNLPHLIGWALAREPRGSERRMAKLLAPYAGNLVSG